MNFVVLSLCSPTVSQESPFGLETPNDSSTDSMISKVFALFLGLKVEEVPTFNRMWNLKPESDSNTHQISFQVSLWTLSLDIL